MQAVDVANMEMNHAEKLKRMRNTMKGQGSGWVLGLTSTLRICDVILYIVHVLCLSFNVSEAIFHCCLSFNVCQFPFRCLISAMFQCILFVTFVKFPFNVCSLSFSMLVAKREV